MRLPNVLWYFVVLMVIVLFAVIVPAMLKVVSVYQRDICGANLEGVSCAMTVYLGDYEGRFPSENWCDLLIEKEDLFPKSLICPGSKDIEGECSYAMNKNLAGKNLSDFPEDTVLFFETDIGLEESHRNTTIKSRRYYEFMNKSEGYNSNHRVFEKRFNQYGGPEDLLLRHNLDGKKGCFISFVIGKTCFVTEDEIANLRWTAE